MIIPNQREHEPNRDYAFRVLRENLINMELKPGTLIAEQEIANILGVSRTPVHEAFLELSRSQIIIIHPQRGCEISMIDYDRIEEARFFRSTIETAIIKETCDRATDADLAELEEIIKLQEFYSENPNREKFLELDNDFHKKMYMICNKQQTHYMVSIMSLHFDRVRTLTLNAVNNAKIITDHKNIFEAIKTRKVDKAVAHFQKHMSRFEVDWDDIVKQYGQYIKQ